jgi:hypothetical protein
VGVYRGGGLSGGGGYALHTPGIMLKIKRLVLFYIYKYKLDSPYYETKIN